MTQTKRPNDQGMEAENGRPAKAVKAEGMNGHCNGTANGKHHISDEKLREDLANGHRLIAAYGMDELHWNHFSARQSSWAYNDFYITPGDRMWCDIYPQHLERSSHNVTANVLHSACYQACPHALAVCHVHSPAIEAVSCLADGLMFLSQSSAPFYERVAYHDWQGFSDDDKEAEDIIKSFKTSARPARALIMRNHGAISIGKTVGEAFVAMYYLNRICAVQLKVLSTGQKINYPLKESMEQAAKQFDENEDFQWGVEWPALTKWIANSQRGDVPPVLRSNLS
jgi:ribulose-5-phosphate 4-epimerase/fuculose-1-phosphate aldolase